MIKHQVHEQLKSFTGTSVKTLCEQATNYVKNQKGIAPKSLSVVCHNSEAIVSLGYTFTSGDPYDIAIVSAPVAMEGSESFDSKLNRAINDTPNVICHSHYVDFDGNLKLAFILHR